LRIETGLAGARMEVSLVKDGPAAIVLETGSG
jgi:D-Tyr-tRNAtyr deacylase